jgi:5-oxoprolinase (ATP-hydrolysing) subunit A
MNFKMNYSIDINADLGEGFPFDVDIIPMISSCSIASGGHFGDEASMRNTIRLAKRYNVKVGAHPSFPDTKNFGRIIMELTNVELQQSLVQQMEDFFMVCGEEQIEVNHIKLHGALYNLAAIDEKIAGLVIQSILKVTSNTMVYLPGNSVLYAKAKGILPLKREAFIDRSYTESGLLVSRNLPGAILDTPEKCLKQLVKMVIENKVTTINGNQIPIQAETFCIHGDHPNSVAVLKYLHQNLANYQIELQ